MKLARNTRDTTGADGAALVGRGYEVRADDDSPLPARDLDPGHFVDIAVVDVDTALEHHQPLRSPAFGVGRPVQLRPAGDAGGIAVLDEAGDLEAGRVPDASVQAVRQLLEREPDLLAWVFWEWLRDDGRAGLQVAISRPELAPRRLAPPSQGTGARASSALGDARTWAILGAVVVVVLIVFVSCS